LLQQQGGMYLKEARVNPDGDQITVATVLDLSFCVYSERETLSRVSAHFGSPAGELFFASPSEAVRVRPGANWFHCRVPAHLLNDGICVVTAVILEGSSSVRQTVPEALIFEVQDSSRSDGWHGKWPGCVRPMLSWSFDRAGPNV